MNLNMIKTQNRCQDLCKVNTVCFTEDQKICIKDMIMNKICAIRPVIQHIQECENISKDTRDLLELIIADLKDLSDWCRKL